MAETGLIARSQPPAVPPSGAGDPGDGGLRGFRRLAVGAIVTSLLLIALGGAVRATDSGLACPDWPRCFGRWVPPADPHIWIEHTHRLVAGVVALMVAGLAAWALARFRHRRDLVVPAVVALVLVLGQAALGALVVLHLLRAELVTAHLGMAMIVLASLLLLAVNTVRPARELPAAGRFHRTAALVVALLCLVQILVGGHVTGIAAGLVWTDFPLMGGRVLPEVVTERELFHVAHRGLALVLVLGAAWLAAVAIRERRTRTTAGTWRPEHRWLVKLPMWAATLVVLQIGLGVANLATRTSAVTVIPHLAVASWIWAVLALNALLARRLVPEAGGPR